MRESSDPCVHPSSTLREIARCMGFIAPISVSDLINRHQLAIPFLFGVHNLSFRNFDDGIPSPSTFRQTFGAAEIVFESIPIVGHPILLFAFYLYYVQYLKGEANGGDATGFCTALASLVTDRFWQGRTDTHTTVTKASVHEWLTAVHGKILSRESLISFHEQGREGIVRVERTFREIEATFLRGVNRDNAPLLFFIPSGAIWDEGYIEKLGDSHCVMPYRLVYPVGATPGADPDRVEMLVWDTNEPDSNNCRLVFQRAGEHIEFEYFPDRADGPSDPDDIIRSQDGFTLGIMTNGQYLLADHDLPFSAAAGGPLGLETFILDFLLSPADLQVTNTDGLRTGNFGGKIYSEIPDSHPCYLMKGAYLLPPQVALTRRIVGRTSGSYDYVSITPDGNSVTINGVSTAMGQEDVLSLSADSMQVRFRPAVEKTFSITMARKVGDEMRVIAITEAGADPREELDITGSPEMSSVRMTNNGSARNVNVHSFRITGHSNIPVSSEVRNLRIPARHHLAISVTNWSAVNLTAEARAPE